MISLFRCRLDRSFGLVRSYVSNNQNGMIFNLNKIPVSAQENLFASQNWLVPSDHIAQYAKINDLRLGTWNILNHLYVPHLSKVPGWRDSYPVQMSKLKSLLFPDFTAREEEICRIIFRVMKEDASVDVLCIQECSDAMFALLKNCFEPKNIAVILSNGNRNNHVVTLVNREVYSILDVKIKPIFKRYIKEKAEWFMDEWRPALDVVLEKRGIPAKFRVVNIHISSAGQSDSYKADRLDEVKSYVEHSQERGIPTIVSGDYNACKSLVGRVFQTGDYKSLGISYSQFENIVISGGVEEPHLVSIDDVMLRHPEGAARNFEARGIHPKETSDQHSAHAIETLFDPILAKRKSILE